MREGPAGCRLDCLPLSLLLSLQPERLPDVAQRLWVAHQAAPAPGGGQLDVVHSEVLLQTFPTECPGAGNTGEETSLCLATAPAADPGLGPVLLLLTFIAVLADWSGKLGVEQNLPDLPDLEELEEAGPAPFRAAGQGGVTQEDPAVPGTAGTSLAAPETLRRDC